MCFYVCVLLSQTRLDSGVGLLPGVPDEGLLQVDEDEAEGRAEDDENVAQKVEERVLSRSVLTLGVL